MARIYCKTMGANQVGFYLQADGKEYFLCKQRFYASLWEYFSGGVELHSIFTKAGKHSHAIREVKRKLPAYVEYIEREEDVRVLSKSPAKEDFRIGEAKRRRSREGYYNWRKDRLAVV